MTEKPQRPRSKLAHGKVLDSAIELFAERGIEGTSIDAIAAASGVSKATIYNHWADKEALCLEAMSHVHGLHLEGPKFDSGDLLQDITDFLAHKPPEHLNDLRKRLMPHLIAYSARNPKFGLAWRARAIEPGRVKAIELMGRGVAQGTFPADLDMSLGIAMLIGPMMYFHIFGAVVPVPTNLAEGVAHAFWKAFARDQN